MCAFRPCISFTPKNTRHRFPTDLCNAVENQAAGLFFIYRFVLSLREGRPDPELASLGFAISIHAPARGATLGTKWAVENIIFQFTSLREGRQTFVCLCLAAFSISIHAPARGATDSSVTYDTSAVFQFTPLREGRHKLCGALGCTLRISIHAPARGATSFSVFSAICDSISIHAPARGATQGPPQGGQGQTLISIHAPARGATSAGDQERCPGADFNSRPCERGDAAREVVRKRANISIHAPARGATAAAAACCCRPLISIHAPARGATCPGGTHKITPKHFNSRPCERGDGKIKQNMLCFFCNYREKLPTFRQHQLS